MRFIIVQVVFLLLSVTAFAAPVSGTKHRPIAKVTHIVHPSQDTSHNLIPAADFFADTLSAEPHLVIIGDSEQADYGRLDADVIKTLHDVDSRFECVFVEDSGSQNAAMAEYYNHRSATFDNTIGAAELAWIKRIYPDNTNQGFQDGLIQYAQEVSSMVKSLHMQARGVDVPIELDNMNTWAFIDAAYNSPDDQAGLLDTAMTVLQLRNSFFAMGIEKFVRKMHCERSIAFLGAAHEMNSLQSEGLQPAPIVPLQNLLRAAKIKTDIYLDMPFFCGTSDGVTAHPVECAQLNASKPDTVWSRPITTDDEIYEGLPMGDSLKNFKGIVSSSFH